MTFPTTADVLTAAHVTITLDQWERPVIVLPDDVAARLAASSRTDVKDYGYCHFESRRFGADTYETRAIRTLFEAVLAAHPDEQGLGQYEQFGTGYFYGWIVGASGWDMDARTWTDGDVANLVYGIHLHHDGRSHFGS
ncbi:hypothetical protein [Streptomyces noursei]|uniref:hypothetical protein n=1 Tax=Streptomyces noursei TaxID=1971 RepID=UPI00167ACF1B|nr:hypothetical protein [Streptomyces noursei]MCZ1014396.1 hypothetical protein [Streptomyces noursei]GGW94692.1 hypothetical protein GCM10010341_14810 [Streptomyces noursei]